jgi:hypothetical protein
MIASELNVVALPPLIFTEIDIAGLYLPLAATNIIVDK